jgi:hypothetical protein
MKANVCEGKKKRTFSLLLAKIIVQASKTPTNVVLLARRLLTSFAAREMKSSPISLSKIATKTASKQTPYECRFFPFLRGVCFDVIHCSNK